jgi:aldehyde dehydrogenase (NAD+)/betaine-aldehyde dehydrogenase
MAYKEVAMTLAPPRRFDAHWIGGRWQKAQTDAEIEVVDPSDESVLATVPSGTAADAQRAIMAAREAFPGWAATPLPQRLGFLERLVAGLEQHAGELADIITSEVGAPAVVARRAQVGLAIGVAASYVPITSNYTFEESVGNSIVSREPVGVVGAITPWNMPLLLTLQKIVPAVVAGCTVVLKPSELTPLHAYRLAEIIAECDLPPGVFNMVVGEGPAVGAELARHPAVDLVSLTGSTRAGSEVARLAASPIKRVHLELGGKSASIVLDDADLERAVRANVDQVCFNTGQACLQWSRLLVPRDRQEEALELAAKAMADYRIGDPRDPATDLGPLVSAAALERVRGYLQTGIDQGARLVAGGPERPDGLDRGYYVRPTLFGDVDNQMTIAREEIFGPVLSVIPYGGTDDDAIRIANDSPYGLHGAVWSADSDRAFRVARSIRTGLVDINGGPFNPLAPFGGVKQSGIGRECGVAGLEGFLETKSYQLPEGSAAPIGPQVRAAT